MVKLFKHTVSVCKQGCLKIRKYLSQIYVNTLLLYKPCYFAVIFHCKKKDKTLAPLYTFSDQCRSLLIEVVGVIIAIPGLLPVPTANQKETSTAKEIRLKVSFNLSHTSTAAELWTTLQKHKSR